MNEIMIKRLHKGYRRAFANIYDRLVTELINANGEYADGLNRALDIVVDERVGINYLIKCLYEGK